jgi:hypothetical protein
LKYTSGPILRPGLTCTRPTMFAVPDCRTMLFFTRSFLPTKVPFLASFFFGLVFDLDAAVVTGPPGLAQSTLAL